MPNRFVPAAFPALTLATRAFGQQPAASLPPPTSSPPNAEATDPSIRDSMLGDSHDSGSSANGRFWADIDALGWWLKGSPLPPLVTTSPAGTPRQLAGVPGAPGKSILFGGSDANNGLRLGGRVNLGLWLDCEQTSGLQVGFFGLEGLGNTFYVNSPGSSILARPFTDVTTNLPASELVAFPGLVAGSVTINPTSSSFLGANALFRQKICCGSCYRLDALAGYQYLHFGDGVALSENLISANSGGSVPLGTNLVVNDSFRANNDFSGVNAGLVGRAWRGHWMMEGLATLAVGRNSQTVQINGDTTVTVPGSTPVVNSGGLLALVSNIGTYHNNPWSLAPQFGGRIGYQINRNFYCFVGYTLLYWNNVVRAGNQIDTNVNPNLIPPIVGAPNGPLQPAPMIHESSFWAQGVSLGVGFRF